MPDFQSFKKRAMKTMFRKKPEEDLDIHTNENLPRLSRVLGLADLTSLGVGSTLGLGAYVLAGEVAHTCAGPAVILSFIFAAVTSTLSGLCYAEFASRVPKAGSAYAFSYVGVGEIIAFLIGWDLILEFSIGGASVARSLSEHIDKPLNGTMKEFFEKIPFIAASDHTAKYPDLFAVAFIIVLTVLIAWGMRESSFLNNAFTIVNMLTVSVVIVTGLFYVDIKNWRIPENENNKGDTGGFMPFGWSGVFKGAAKCFYGFIGFDAIATSGEEAKKPSRNIPLAIIGSLVIITTVYCSLATILTLIVSYRDLRDNESAPFIQIFDDLHLYTIRWIVTIGAIFAICATMIGSLYPLPRILYAMACDGLLFEIFAKINPKTRTPFWGTIICGFFCVTLTTFFNLSQLMEMMSVGTLMAYTLVCICVLFMRYRHEVPKNMPIYNGRGHQGTNHSAANGAVSHVMTTKATGRSSKLILCVYTILALFFCISIKFVDNNFKFVPTSMCAVLGLCLLFLCFLLWRLPEAHNTAAFHVPLVPFVPCISIVLNIFFMTQLEAVTWCRVFGWMAVGIMVYLFYGLRYSKEGLKELQRSSDEGELEPMQNGVMHHYHDKEKE